MYALILMSLFTYIKILNINYVGTTKIIYGMIFSGLLSYGIFLLRTPLPYVRFAIMILALGVFMEITTHTRLDLALTGVIVSVGMNYGFSLVSLIISALLIYLFSQSENTILATILSTAMQSILLVLLFRIKRFKKGILFLQKKGSGAIGLVISGLILLVVTLINNRDIEDDTAWWFFLMGAILCAVGLIFWWRSGLTRLYREKIKERNIQEYEKILAEKEEELQKFQKNNDVLAKVIHTDNKILMAMHELVTFYHEHYNGPDSNYRLSSKRFLNHIEELIRERAGAITQNQRVSKILPSTRDDLIDGVMKYMLSKASKEDIQFDITIIGNISELLNTVIPAIEFETLCADLIENAIIATSYSDYKRILIMLGTNEGFYELNVQDSGIPFEIDTLMDLGLKKASTHLDEGGSGIGYMTIFEILHEFKASIIITEYKPKQYGFTKSVKVRFDNKDEYIVQTYRADEFLIPQDQPVGSPIVISLV